MTPETPPPDPAVVIDLLEAFRRSKVMFAAVSLGIFDAIGGTARRRRPSWPRPCRSTRTALARLLDAAVGLKLLERRGRRVREHAGRLGVPLQVAARRG